MLDLGFQSEMDSVVRNLPRGRQTMLFSATLSKNVRALARLSLRVRALLPRRAPPVC
jgi:superfamily II DNA/RNA helicase